MMERENWGGEYSPAVELFVCVFSYSALHSEQSFYATKESTEIDLYNSPGLTDVNSMTETCC